MQPRGKPTGSRETGWEPAGVTDTGVPGCAPGESQRGPVKSWISSTFPFFAVWRVFKVLNYRLRESLHR